MSIAPQDYGLTSHTTHIICVNFIREWGDLHFNPALSRYDYFTLTVFARNLPKGNCCTNISFSYPKTRALHLISEHTTYDYYSNIYLPLPPLYNKFINYLDITIVDQHYWVFQKGFSNIDNWQRPFSWSYICQNSVIFFRLVCQITLDSLEYHVQG